MTAQMKVTCRPAVLGQALQVVSRAISSRTTLPILNNILIETTADGLALTATNLEIGIRKVAPAEALAEGSTTAPGRLLTDRAGAQGRAGKGRGDHLQGPQPGLLPRRQLRAHLEADRRKVSQLRTGYPQQELDHRQGAHGGAHPDRPRRVPLRSRQRQRHPCQSA